MPSLCRAAVQLVALPDKLWDPACIRRRDVGLCGSLSRLFSMLNFGGKSSLIRSPTFASSPRLRELSLDFHPPPSAERLWRQLSRQLHEALLCRQLHALPRSHGRSWPGLTRTWPIFSALFFARWRWRHHGRQHPLPKLQWLDIAGLIWTRMEFASCLLWLLQTIWKSVPVQATCDCRWFRHGDK